MTTDEGWYRRIGNFYTELAATTTDDTRRAACEQTAQRYNTTADRLHARQQPADSETGEH
jgi:hypothetical protein